MVTNDLMILSPDDAEMVLNKLRIEDDHAIAPIRMSDTHYVFTVRIPIDVVAKRNRKHTKQEAA